MTLKAGVGTLTAKGLAILNYCALHDVSLDFQEVVLTSDIITFANITNPEYIFGTASASDTGVNKEVFEATITNDIEGVIVKGDESYANEAYILPLVSELPVNSIISEVDIMAYAMFVVDPTGHKLTLASSAEASSFTLGETVTDSGTHTGTVSGISGAYIFVTGISTTFVNGTITGSLGGSGTIQSGGVNDAKTLFYMGCLTYNDSPSNAIEPITLIPGMSMPFRTEIRYASGLPETITFLNTSTAEIVVHNVRPEAHEAYLLRLDGANSPSSDIDWDSNKLTGLSDATVASDATNYGQITTLSSVSGAIATLPLLVTDLSALPFFIKHSYSRYVIAPITQWTGAIGSTLVIENLNGTEEVVIDLYGYDLDIGTPMNNKTNIKILNCTAPIKIINTNQLYTSAIIQYNASTHNDSYPYEITTSNILIENSSNVTIGGDIGALRLECATSGNAVGIYANNSNVTLDHIYFKDGTVAVFSDHGSKIKMTRCMSTSGNLQEKAIVCANGGEIYYRQHTKLTLTGVVGNFEIGEYIGEATPATDTFIGKIEGISGTTDNILWLYDAAGDISISSSFVGSSSGATGTKSAYDATKMQGSSGNYDIYFEGVGVVYTDCKYGFFNNAQEFELYSGISGDDEALFRNDGIGYIVDTGSYGATFYTFSGNWDVTGAGNVDNDTTYSSAVTSFANSPNNRIFPITMNIRRP